VAQLRIEHAAKIAELEQRAIEIRQAAITEFEQQETQWQRKLGAADEQTAASHRVVAELQQQLAELSQSYEREYEGRIDNLQLAKQLVDEQLERNATANSQMQRVFIVLVIVLTLAGVGVGAITGWVIGANTYTATDTSSVVDTVDGSRVSKTPDTTGTTE